MDTFFDKDARNSYWKKKGQHLQQMMLVKLDACLWNNPNQSILIRLHKTQLQMDQTST